SEPGVRGVRADAAVGAVQGVDLLDLLGGELEIGGGDVRDDPGGGDRLGDHHVADRQVPGDDHLARVHAVRLGDLRDHRVLQDVAALAQRGPGLGEDAL